MKIDINLGQQCKAIALAYFLFASQVVRAESCLIPTDSVSLITQSRGKIEPVTKTHSVVRPCSGKVGATPVSVLYSVGDGQTRQHQVLANTVIESSFQQVLPVGKRLVDVFPRNSILSSVSDVVFGRKRPSELGLSGFESGSNHAQFNGEILQIPISFSPQIFGFDSKLPLVFVQGNKRLELQLRDDLYSVDMNQFQPGPMEVLHGTRRIKITVVALSEEPELAAGLKEMVDGLPGVNLRRALLMQEFRYLINSTASFLQPD